MTELQRTGYSHGDIQPANIYLDSNGNLKLVDFMCYDHQKTTGFLRMIHSSDYQSPIPPELMNHYFMLNMNHQHSLEKIDVYALGITILSALTIQDFRQF